MATDPYLFERMCNILNQKKVLWLEKRMFGGNCFMVEDKMCFATYKGGLMLRVDPSEILKLIEREGASQMIHAGKKSKGYLFLEAEGYDAEEDLEFWIQKCLDFNPQVKLSKKK